MFIKSFFIQVANRQHCFLPSIIAFAIVIYLVLMTPVEDIPVLVGISFVFLCCKSKIKILGNLLWTKILREIYRNQLENFPFYFLSFKPRIAIIKESCLIQYVNIRITFPEGSNEPTRGGGVGRIDLNLLRFLVLQRHLRLRTN